MFAAETKALFAKYFSQCTVQLIYNYLFWFLLQIIQFVGSY